MHVPLYDRRVGGLVHDCGNGVNHLTVKLDYPLCDFKVPISITGRDTFSVERLLFLYEGGEWLTTGGATTIVPLHP